MTHTLNRRGLSEARPGEEIVVLFMVHQREKDRKLSGMVPLIDAVLKYKPANIIGAPMGLTEEQLRKLLPRGGVITAVFNNQDDVRNLIAEVKLKKLGISMVLSGLFSDVHCLCRANDLKSIPTTFLWVFSVKRKNFRMRRPWRSSPNADTP